MRQIFAEFMRPSNRLQKKLDELAFGTKNFRGELKSTAEIVYEFERLGLSPEMGFQMLQRRSGTGLTALAAAGAEAQYSLQEKHAKGAGKTKEIADLMIDHLIGDLARIKSKMETALEGIAKVGLYQWARKIAETFANLLDWFNRLDESTKRWWTTLGVLAIGIPPLVFVLGKLITKIFVLTTALKAYRAVRNIGGVGALVRGVSGIAGKTKDVASAAKASIPKTLPAIGIPNINRWLGHHTKLDSDYLAKRHASLPDERLHAASMVHDTRRRNLLKMQNELSDAQRQQSEFAKKHLGLVRRQNQIFHSRIETGKEITRLSRDSEAAQRAVLTSERRIAVFKHRQSLLAKRQAEADKAKQRWPMTGTIPRKVALLQREIESEEKNIAASKALIDKRKTELGKARDAQKEYFNQEKVLYQDIRKAHREKMIGERRLLTRREEIERQERQVRVAHLNRQIALGRAGRQFATPRDPVTGRFLPGFGEDKRYWQHGYQQFLRDQKLENASKAEREGAARRYAAAQKLANSQTLKAAQAQGKLRSAYTRIKGLRMGRVFTGIGAGLNIAARAGGSLVGVMGGLPGLFLSIAGIIGAKVMFDKMADNMERASWETMNYTEHLESLRKKFEELAETKQKAKTAFDIEEDMGVTVKLLGVLAAGGKLTWENLLWLIPGIDSTSQDIRGTESKIEDQLKAKSAAGFSQGLDQAGDVSSELERISQFRQEVTKGESELSRILGVISEAKNLEKKMRENMGDFKRELPEVYETNLGFLREEITLLQSQWEVLKPIYDDSMALSSKHESILRQYRGNDITREEAIKQSNDVIEELQRRWDMAEQLGYAGMEDVMPEQWAGHFRKLADAGERVKGMNLDEFFRSLITSLGLGLEATVGATEGIEDNTEAIEDNIDAIQRWKDKLGGAITRQKEMDSMLDLAREYWGLEGFLEEEPGGGPRLIRDIEELKRKKWNLQELIPEYEMPQEHGPRYESEEARQARLDREQKHNR